MSEADEVYISKEILEGILADKSNKGQAKAVMFIMALETSDFSQCCDRVDRQGTHSITEQLYDTH